MSETTVRRLRQTGKIPAIRLTDRIVRFNLRDVRTALARAAKARADEHPAAHDGGEPDRAQMNFSELLSEFDATD